jgi:hypothetical protein
MRKNARNRPDNFKMVLKHHWLLMTKHTYCYLLLIVQRASRGKGMEGVKAWFLDGKYTPSAATKCVMILHYVLLQPN